jgi:predicted hydrocarbon binding protein
VAALHERLVFDTARGAVLDGPRRYLLLRTDVLMGLFANLDGGARAAALDAFGRSVAENGADSVRAYRESVGASALPSMMEAAAASLGWGRWQFEADDLASLASLAAAADGHAAAAPQRLRLAVTDSPFAAAAQRGGPACHAIAGMLEALGAALFGSHVEARETHCAAQGGEAVCRFVAAPRPGPSTITPTSSDHTPARRHHRQGDPS